MLWCIVAYQPPGTAYPVMVGLIFVMVSIGAFFFFREPVSIRKVIGVAVILAGIAIASTTGFAQVL